MSPLNTLLAEHRAMLAAADALTIALAEPAGFDLRDVGGLRSRLATLLRDHFAAEQKHLVSKLTEPVRAQVSGYAAVVQSTQDIRFAYSAHVQRWSNRAIEEDRRGYAAATAELVLQLKRHAALEEAELYHPGFQALATAVRSAGSHGRNLPAAQLELRGCRA